VASSFKEVPEGVEVGDVQAVEGEIGISLETGQAPLLEPHVVGVVHVVQTNHSVAIFKEKLGYPGGNEACNTGE